jgi:hypothetical protein
MDLGRQRELLPHYLGLLASIVVGLGAVQVSLGDVGVPVHLGAVVFVVLLYPTVVRLLGVAPSTWEH